MRESKSDFFTFCEMILNEIYKEKISMRNLLNDKSKNMLEIIIGKSNYFVETKFELKVLLRELVSSEVVINTNDIIRSIIKIKYGLTDKKSIGFLNEIYPNIDIFVASYIKLTNNNHLALEEIKKINFDYNALFEFLIRSYIDDITFKKSKHKNKYEELINKKNIVQESIDHFENRLRVFQVIKKNKFYYETYQNFFTYEEESFNEDKIIIEDDIHNLEKDLMVLNKKLEKLKKQNYNFTKMNKITKNILNSKKESCLLAIEKLNIDILLLEKEKDFLLKELGKMISLNKNNIKRNVMAFKKFLEPYNISVEQYLEGYQESILVDCKDILNEVNHFKKILLDIDKEIEENCYINDCRILKYFCLDNLKIMDKNIEMDSIVIDNIVEMLTINSI